MKKAYGIFGIDSKFGFVEFIDHYKTKGGAEESVYMNCEGSFVILPIYISAERYQAHYE